ncbi:MAG: hypothetical protein KF824_06440 [Fimbriimonadaceae bacterium]|nr:MAG: hypothetical protein KF824_06440 [Fimbriimonadaceae bacterium]
MIRVAVAAVLLCSMTAARAQINLPGVKPPKIEIPSLADLMRGEAPLTTTIKDARILGWTNFRNLNLHGEVALQESGRTKEGTWNLTPGHYTVDLETFCGKGYTYGPTKGMGYVIGPWKGSRTKFLQDLLHRYSLNRGVKQKDMQLLIWAVLARVKPQDMTGDAQRALVALMGKDGGKLMADGALDYFTGKVADDLFNKASSELRPVLEYENKMRGLYRDANATYDQFERLAMLEAPEDLRSEVERGVWNIHPKGYLVRYFPAGYSRTKVEIIIPRRATLNRDAQKRVTEVSWSDGFKINIQYGDQPAENYPGDSQVKAHFVSGVTITDASGNVIKSEKTGWLLSGIPSKKKLGLQTLNLRLHLPFPLGQGWLGGAREGYERASDLRDRIETYEEWYDRTQRIERGDPPSEGLFDSNHINDLIDSIFGGTDDRLEQIGETHGRLAEHLANATNLLDGLPTTSTVDPTDGVILPANGGSQRLLGSSRAW